MTDETIIIRVPADKLTKLPNGSYLVDTGLTEQDYLLMLSGAICNPGKGVIMKDREGEE